MLGIKMAKMADGSEKPLCPSCVDIGVAEYDADFTGASRAAAEADIGGVFTCEWCGTRFVAYDGRLFEEVWTG